ncbi:MAG: hypothetical protein N2D54_06375 [Chloroflexota bacterium]
MMNKSRESQDFPVEEILSTDGQLVDMETVQEFIEQTLENVDLAELREIEAELIKKGERLSELLAKDAIPDLTDENLIHILKVVFATRRRAKQILENVGAKAFKDAIHELLYSPNDLESRFETFVQTMTAYFEDVRVLRPKKSLASRAAESAEKAALQENVFCDLGSELLHFIDPNQYWLWTRWMWDPHAGTGALPLVTVEDITLYGDNVGKTYMKVGMAITFIKETGNAAGFANFGTTAYNIDVFMACVYAVYMYTTLRLRMTQEFNKVIPELPELTRRLLGVWKMEL